MISVYLLRMCTVFLSIEIRSADDLGRVYLLCYQLNKNVIM
jgi:hypothetical protein